jgi:hypothetical protein
MTGKKERCGFLGDLHSTDEAKRWCTVDSIEIVQSVPEVVERLVPRELFFNCEVRALPFPLTDNSSLKFRSCGLL